MVPSANADGLVDAVLLNEDVLGSDEDEALADISDDSDVESVDMVVEDTVVVKRLPGYYSLIKPRVNSLLRRLPDSIESITLRCSPNTSRSVILIHPKPYTTWVYSLVGNLLVNTSTFLLGFALALLLKTSVGPV